MKFKELVAIMNIADVTVASESIPGLFQRKRIDMFHLGADPLVAMYGECEVEKLTNIAKAGDTIWIK